LGEHVQVAKLPGSSPGRILRVWFALSVQSFGGGVATLTLIRSAAVDTERWVTEAEFTHFWALSRITPGINIFALAILLGKRVGGAAGVAAALAGLLFPSVTITILMTALYARFRHAGAVQDALHGVLPATIGLGLVTTWQIMRPLADAARKEGADSAAVAALVLVGSGAAIAVWHVPVVAALVAGGGVCALHAWLRSKRARQVEDR
jgi:chromate transporter